MDLALEEPQEEDTVLQVDGLRIALPPDAAMCLGLFDSATLDKEVDSDSMDRFFFRFGRRSRFR
jgi:hypothetical protein